MHKFVGMIDRFSHGHVVTNICCDMVSKTDPYLCLFSQSSREKQPYAFCFKPGSSKSKKYIVQ
jgi:hypothetical protein